MEIGDEVIILKNNKFVEKGKKGVIIKHSNIHEDDLNWHVRIEDTHIGTIKLWFKEDDLKVITWSVS